MTETQTANPETTAFNAHKVSYMESSPEPFVHTCTATCACGWSHTTSGVAGSDARKSALVAGLNHSSDEYYKSKQASKDDSIQLQSPDAIALNGLINDLEFQIRHCKSMADMHWSHYKNVDIRFDSTRDKNFISFGIYQNRVQELEDLVNKWKPNKK